MLKKISVVLCACAGSALYAGLIDNGDDFYLPKINPDAHTAKVACTHFPEIKNNLPTTCCSREWVWRYELDQASEKLKLSGKALEDLKKLEAFVLDPVKAPIAQAPHEALLEFELYARGCRELAEKKQSTQLMVSWKKLLDLPVEKRRYTTIPVLYNYYRRSQVLEKNTEILQRMQQAVKAGCRDSQGCQLALIDLIKPAVHSYDNWQLAYQLLFRKQFTNRADFLPDKKNDIYLPFCDGPHDVVDRLYTYSGLSPDIYYNLYLEKEENLRLLCQNDPAMRDLIVARGLILNGNYDLCHVAMEFAMQSPVNYPLLALRIKYPAAEKLLRDKPEHRRLYDLLALKHTDGEAKIKAIDEYIARYPDAQSNDHYLLSISYSSYRELHALAGTELFKLGKVLEAAERYLKGCTAEDMAIIAEQYMSIEELIAFCEKHLAKPVLREYEIYSDNCPKARYLHSFIHYYLNAGEINYLVRNTLARRLMRAGRFNEAEKYFTGSRTRELARKFFEQKRRFDSKNASSVEKFYAAMNMAALMRFYGNVLYGTTLEPDNLICRNKFKCEWGTNQSAVKLVKPGLPRYSYRYKAAELYKQASEYAPDRKLKGYSLWCAGTLLKNIDPAAADKYFKKLYAVAPELTRNNWFLPGKDAPELLEFYNRYLFVEGCISNYTPSEPMIANLDIAEKNYTRERCYEYAAKLYKSAKNIALSEEDYLELTFMLKRAGDLQLPQADIMNADIMEKHFQDCINALWFLRRAEKTLGNDHKLNFDLGRIYIALGYWQEGIAIIKELADDQKADELHGGVASFFMYRVYKDGRWGVPADQELGKRYIQQAVKCANAEALYEAAAAE